MSKLLKLKRWLSLQDAAKRLTIGFGEDVTEADLLRFALDGHLRISVHLVNGAIGCLCKTIEPEQIKYSEVPCISGNGKTVKIPESRVFYDSGVGCFEISRHALQLENDVYDLPMFGGERLDIEHAYQFKTGGPAVTDVNLEGVFVQVEDGTLFELQELTSHPPSNDPTQSSIYGRSFHPAGALPTDSVFVVRATALQAFERHVSDLSDTIEKPLATTERNTLLKLVIGMAVGGYSYHPKASKSSTPKEIADDLAELGISITDDTVRKYLKEAAQTFLPEGKPKP